MDRPPAKRLAAVWANCRFGTHSYTRFDDHPRIRIRTHSRTSRIPRMCIISRRVIDKEEEKHVLIDTFD